MYPDRVAQKKVNCCTVSTAYFFEPPCISVFVDLFAGNSQFFEITESLVALILRNTILQILCIKLLSLLNSGDPTSVRRAPATLHLVPVFLYRCILCRQPDIRNTQRLAACMM